MTPYQEFVVAVRRSHCDCLADMTEAEKREVAKWWMLAWWKEYDPVSEALLDHDLYMQLLDSIEVTRLQDLWFNNFADRCVRIFAEKINDSIKALGKDEDQLDYEYECNRQREVDTA